MILETVKIKAGDSWIKINKSDYNPAIHELVTDEMQSSTGDDAEPAKKEGEEPVKTILTGKRFKRSE
jgi:hypothetical protein